MLALHEMPEDIRRAIGSCDVEVITEVLDGSSSAGSIKGEKVVKVRATKVKFWNKLKAIEQIAKGERTSGGLMTSEQTPRHSRALLRARNDWCGTLGRTSWCGGCGPLASLKNMATWCRGWATL